MSEPGSVTEKLADGSMDVAVSRHKTAAGGPSHLTFFRENLYAACRRYQDIFKRPEDGTGLLFGTDRGGEQ